MPAANDQLRAARERTASPTHPGVGLSRQELADLVNTWVWNHHNKMVLAALQDGSSGPTPVPKRVGATEIEQTRAATQVFESWSFTYGGGLARETVFAQLRWSASLLEVTCPDRLRPKLLSAVGDLADVAGDMAYDADAHEQARWVFGFALGCAEQAKDWHLRAQVLSSMAAQATGTGQPDEGLTLTEHALVRADRLTATERTMLHTHRARALAKMRRVRETLIAVGTADDHFAHSTPAEDPPFLAYYNAGMHAGNTGRALFDLALLGHHPAQATDRLTAAVAGNAPSHARRQAISLAKLASLMMATGDPLQAVTIGDEALDAAGTIRSRRAADCLRELSRHAAPHHQLDEVAHLRHRIATLLVGADSP